MLFDHRAIFEELIGFSLYYLCLSKPLQIVYRFVARTHIGLERPSTRFLVNVLCKQ